MRRICRPWASVVTSALPAKLLWAIVETCRTDGATPGDPLFVAAGTTELLDLTRIRHTGILRPNHLGELRFAIGKGGRLVLGEGDGEIEVCARAERCEATPPFDIVTGGDGIAAGCAATLAEGSYCGEGTTTFSSFGFDIPQEAGVCSDPDELATPRKDDKLE